MRVHPYFQIFDIAFAACGLCKYFRFVQIGVRNLSERAFVRNDLSVAKLAPESEVPLLREVPGLFKTGLLEALPETLFPDPGGGVPGAAFGAPVDLQTAVEHRMRCHCFSPCERGRTA